MPQLLCHRVGVPAVRVIDLRPGLERMAVGVNLLAQVAYRAGDLPAEVPVTDREDRALEGDALFLAADPLAALALVVMAARLDLLHGMEQAGRYHRLSHFEQDTHYSSTFHVIEFLSRPVTMRGLSA